MPPPIPSAIQTAFDQIAPAQRDILLTLRVLIYHCAETVAAVPLNECLRWGQPSYIAPKGSSLRLGVSKTGKAALFAHCQSSLIPRFKDRFPDDFQFDGNRAVHLDRLTAADQDKLRFLILHGLQYKLR